MDLFSKSADEKFVDTEFHFFEHSFAMFKVIAPRHVRRALSIDQRFHHRRSLYVAYRDEFFHELPPGHTFPMRKYPELFEILVREDLVTDDRIIRPEEVISHHHYSLCCIYYDTWHRLILSYRKKVISYMISSVALWRL